MVETVLEILKAFGSKESSGVFYTTTKKLLQTTACSGIEISSLRKHLKQNVPYTQYHGFKIRRSVSFIVIDKYNSRIRAKIGGKDGLQTSLIDETSLMLSLEDEDDFDYSVEDHSTSLSIGNAVTETLEDVLHHVINLKQNDSALCQLDFLNGNLISRLGSYMEDVHCTGN